MLGGHGFSFLPVLLYLYRNSYISPARYINRVIACTGLYVPTIPIRIFIVQKMPITPEGLRRLEDELRQLKSEERPAVIKAIAEARAHGDLSENAEYHAAREKQSFIEGRIVQLEGLIGSAEVIDPALITDSRIRFGAHVEVADEDTGKEQSFQIVGVPEADIKAGRISISSPIARALIGKEAGDTASVPAPGGDKAFEILKVIYR